MNKLFWLTTVMLLIFNISTVHCQTEKNVRYRIGIGGFTHSFKQEKSTVGSVLGEVANTVLTGKATHQRPQYADAVRASIVSGLGNVIRLDVVDRCPDSHEDAFYVDGIISNISTTSKLEPTKKGEPDREYFRALITVTVNLKNAKTDEITDSRVFSITDNDGGWMSSAEKSVDYALRKLANNITAHYNGIFPLSASVVEGGEVSKDKQKTVYADLGSACGAYVGLHFTVFSVKTIAGKEARIEVGRLKIEKVLGEELSLCKVSKGNKQIKEALDNGDTLVLTSRN